ncbi:MAG: hypothetical protein NC898_04550 [Candidatus Omnitrophica bacterium]|nr:hypothetical protein [Candidatus Omnitrophota bacterium]MCM8793717.1 hypothetical protein [Candidatus Omnitrophota bacterium]
MRRRLFWLLWLVLGFLILRLVKSVFAEEKTLSSVQRKLPWQLFQEREENLQKQLNSFNNILYNPIH